MQTRLLFLVSLFIALLASSANAQRVKVSLAVNGPDDAKNKIFSYLVAELAQRGVDLVGDGADYQIRIIVVNVRSKGRRGTGYAVSVAVIAPVSPDGLATASGIRSSPIFWKWLRLTGYRIFANAWRMRLTPACLKCIAARPPNQARKTRVFAG